MSDPFIATSTFYNEIYALDIALEQHLADLMFGGDLSRIVYSPTDYALRKRYERSETQTLDLPFATYYLTNVTNGNIQRQWTNQTANVEGIFVPELKRKIRYNPITLQYDLSVFGHKNTDMIYFQNQLLWDDSNETNIDYFLEIDSQHTMRMIAHLAEHAFNFSPRYTESDWLERNKIRAIEDSIQLETFIILDNYNVVIPETVLFNFVRNKGADEEVATNYAAALDFVAQEIGEFEKV